MNTRQITNHKKQYLELLLLGDEQESMIDRYLEKGEMYVLEDHGVKAVCVVQKVSAEILEIKKYVPEALNSISHLIIETDENRNPIAFMGIEDNKLEMLFVTSECRGKGIGKNMLLHGIEIYGINNLSVNEDNPQAKGFYEYMGFKVYGRNELDDQGKPYPVLYMKLEK